MDREKVQDVIDILRDIEVDGETMQYILECVGMSDQMTRQLIMTGDLNEIESTYQERTEYEVKIYDWYDNDVDTEIDEAVGQSYRRIFNQ
jgi:hypothetical protein